MKILTYREPQNPEYIEFVNNLKTDARDMFNYTVEDSLVSSVCVWAGLQLWFYFLRKRISMTLLALALHPVQEVQEVLPIIHARYHGSRVCVTDS